MPEVRPFFQKAMLLSEVGWNTPPFLTQGPEEPNDFLSPGSEMKWTPLHLGKAYWSICLSIFLSVCLSVCSFHLSICLSIFLWNTPKFLTQGPEEPNDFLSPGSEMKWTPLHLGKPNFCLSVFLSVYLSFCLSVRLSLWNTPPFLTQGPEEPTDFLSPGSEMKWTPLHLGKPNLCLSVCVFVSSVCLSDSLSVCISVRLSLWNTPPFLRQGPEDPNDFLSPGSEMKWTPLHLGKHIYVCLSF
jgi:hypothetical protein